MNLGSVPTVPVGDTYLNSAVNPGGRPGAQAWTRDGRRFRLVKNGAGAIGPGALVQAAVPIAGHTGLSPTVDVAVGAKSIRVTAGGGAGTSVPANTFAGGLAIVSFGPGLMQSFAIKGHEAIVAAQPFTIVFESEEMVTTALTAVGSKVSLVANPYSGVVASIGTAMPVGITVALLDANSWGYVAVEGITAAFPEGAIALGQAVSPSLATPGSVVINSTTLPVIGTAATAAVAGNGFALELVLP